MEDWGRHVMVSESDVFSCKCSLFKKTLKQSDGFTEIQDWINTFFE